jgi:CBS domain-containing protein
MMERTSPHRRPSGLYLESTPDERYGVLPGEDRPVREIMTRRVVTIGPETSVREAAQLMRDHPTDALVVADGSRLLGIVTEHDVVTQGATQQTHPEHIPVRQVLPPGEPIVCSEETILADAARLMAARRRRAVPVLDERGDVSGILSLLDVAGAAMPGAAATWLRRYEARLSPLSQPSPRRGGEVR